MKKTMHFKAESKTGLLNTLKSINIVGPLQNGNRSKDNTEPYAIAHLLSSLAEANDRLTFPLELIRRDPDRPDFLLKMDGIKIGVEHTDARSENETYKNHLRRKEGIGPTVSFVTPVEFPDPAKAKKVAKEEIIKNDPKGGWGDQSHTDKKWAETMLSVIEGKESKLLDPEFTRYDEDWLLIRDAWP